MDQGLSGQRKSELMRLTGFKISLRLDCASGPVQGSMAHKRGILCEEGTTLVEMALASTILLSALFGVIAISLALYVYNYVSDAAREATRYAIVRGPDSCVIASTFPNCNLNPTKITSSTDPTKNPLLNYVYNMGYPGLDRSKLTATVNYYAASTVQVGSGPTGYSQTSWSTTPCTTATCNNRGNAVQVTVTYPFPLSIPFWRSTTVNISSTSQMVISYP